MKQSVQKIANWLGYCISSINAGVSQNAFSELKRLTDHKQNPIIFDVGAHHGDTALKFRELFPKSRIYSFEPFPDSFDALKSNTSEDHGTVPLNFGLSDQIGLRTFYSNSNSATNSLLSTDPSASITWGQGLLETKEIMRACFKTIDSVINDLSIPVIDILKLDVQGAEPLVLKGALEACRDGVIRLIYSEIIIQPTYVNQKRFDEALAVFYDNGFDLHNLYNFCFTSEQKLSQVDAIFVSNKPNKRLPKS